MAANKIFASWTWNRKLPAPFDDVSVNVKSSTHLSTYNTENTRTEIGRASCRERV